MPDRPTKSHPPFTMECLHFHHVGVACASISLSLRGYQAIGYDAEGSDFQDALQGIRGLFLVGPGPRLELLENLEGSRRLDPYLNRRETMYHLGYECRSLGPGIEFLRERGAKLVSPPTPSVAFDGRPICFLMLPSMALVELIEHASVGNKDR